MFDTTIGLVVILSGMGLLWFAIHLGMPHRTKREPEPILALEPEPEPAPEPTYKQKRKTVAGQTLVNMAMFMSFFAAVPATVVLLYFAAVLIGLINAKYGWPMIFGEGNDTYRNWLELCSFAANIIVAGVAWFVVRFASSQAYEARRQAREAERARSAQVHLQITGRYISQSVSESRVVVFHLYSQFDPSGPHKSASQHYHHEVSRLRASRDQKDMLAYMRHTEILCFFEDVGMLVEKHYVLLEDVRKLFGGPILSTRKIFSFHLEERRKTEKKLFENFLALCDEIEKADAAEKASRAGSINRKAARAPRRLLRFGRPRRPATS